MIESRKDYQYYLNQDALALGINNTNIRSRLDNLIKVNYIFKFQKKLRRIEYYKNCKTDKFSKIRYVVMKFRFVKLSRKLGFSIPENVFGPGLAIVHYGTIVVNSKAKIGANCRLHPSTCIGASGGSSKAPLIGDNVYIGPGAKIFGPIKIGDFTAIGANAVVNKSFPKGSCTIAGVPAKVISDNTSSKYISLGESK